MNKTRADFIRAKVEELKAFDIVHELRTINTEAQMGAPDVVPLDAVVEKLKPAFDALTSAMEGLLVEVIGLTSRLDTEGFAGQSIDEEEWRKSITLTEPEPSRNGHLQGKNESNPIPEKQIGHTVQV